MSEMPQTAGKERLWKRLTERFSKSSVLLGRKRDVAPAPTAPKTTFDISNFVDPLEELKIVSEMPADPEKRDKVAARLRTGVDNLLTKFAQFKDIDPIEGGTAIAVNLTMQEGDRPLFFHTRVKIREGQTEKPMFIISVGSSQTDAYFSDGEVIRKASGEQYSELSAEPSAMHLAAEIDYATGNLPEVGEAEMNFVLSLAEKENVGPLTFPAEKFNALHHQRVHGEKVDPEQSKAAAVMFGGYIDDFLEGHGYATDTEVVHKDEFSDVSGSVVTYEAGKRLEQGELVPFANIEIVKSPVQQGVQVYITHELVTDKEKGLIHTRKIGSKTAGPEVEGDRIENKSLRSSVCADIREARSVRNFLATPQ